MTSVEEVDDELEEEPDPVAEEGAAIRRMIA
jgi:hypothetical protein